MKFSEKVYEVLRQVPEGKVATYKQIADIVGTRAYRTVGNALNKNPNAPEVPCRRIVSSKGHVGGYAFGVEEKIKLAFKFLGK